MDLWEGTASPGDEASGPAASGELGLFDGDDDWWLVACMDYPRDRWIGFVQGYWKAATVIVENVASTGRDQDYLVYPFLMCWRHYVELQLKALALLATSYLRRPYERPKTHKIDHLWRMTRPLIEQSFPGSATTDLDDVERILLQLHELDPTSQHFRYPISADGSETLTSIRSIHMRGFHRAMEGLAGTLDGTETGIRAMIDQRSEYEEAMYDFYGSPEGFH